MITRPLFHFSCLALAALTLGSLLSSSTAHSAEAVDAKSAEAVAPVEFFSAMDGKQIEVKFIPANATKANVLIRNKTEQPLTIQLPQAFAGVPVLAQGMMGGGMGGMGGGMGGMGGGMGGGMMGGGMGGMGGMMRVAPGKQQKLTVTTVCLEHGKPDPRPKMAYKIVPLDEFTDREDVAILCESLGYRQLPQNVAQAAAWHLLDDMSWNELAAKNRVESKYTGNIRFFNPAELQNAMLVVNKVKALAKEREEIVPTGSEEDESAELPTESPSLTRFNR